MLQMSMTTHTFFREGRGKMVKRFSLSLGSMYGLLRFKQKVYSDWGSKCLLRLKQKLYSDWSNKGLLVLKQKLYSDWSTRSNQTRKYDLLQQGVYNNE
jgi:hypothetical protein